VGGNGELVCMCQDSRIRILDGYSWSHTYNGINITRNLGQVLHAYVGDRRGWIYDHDGKIYVGVAQLRIIYLINWRDGTGWVKDQYDTLPAGVGHTIATSDDLYRLFIQPSYGTLGAETEAIPGDYNPVTTEQDTVVATFEPRYFFGNKGRDWLKLNSLILSGGFSGNLSARVAIDGILTAFQDFNKTPETEGVLATTYTTYLWGKNGGSAGSYQGSYLGFVIRADLPFKLHSLQTDVYLEEMAEAPAGGH